LLCRRNVLLVLNLRLHIADGVVRPHAELKNLVICGNANPEVGTL
jgi:hypothetical protein